MNMHNEYTDCSLSSMLQRDSSTAQAVAITWSHCYDDYTGCLFLSLSSSSYVYRCLHGLGPDYFSSDFTSVSDLRPRQRLRSASTAALIVPATRHSTLGERPGFSRHWRQAVELTARRHQHCNISCDFFRYKLKTFLFRRSYDNAESWLLDNLLLFYRFYFLEFLFF